MREVLGAMAPSGAGDGDAFAVGQPVTERVGARSDRGASAQGAFDRGPIDSTVAQKVVNQVAHGVAGMQGTWPSWLEAEDACGGRSAMVVPTATSSSGTFSRAYQFRE